MGSYYWQQVIIYQKITDCWVTAKRKKTREGDRPEWRSKLITTQTIKGTARGHLWLHWLFAYGNTFTFIFRMPCPLACWARGLKMLSIQSQESGIYGLFWPLQKLGTTARADGRRQESRRAQLDEGTWGFLLPFLLSPNSIICKFVTIYYLTSLKEWKYLLT